MFHIKNFTLFLSSAKSIRKSPIYERLHILAYNSSCKHINLTTATLLNNETDKEPYLAEFWRQQQKSSGGCSLQVYKVDFFNLQLIHYDVNLKE